MNFLQQIYPGDVIASFVVRVLAEITLVTVVALIFGRIALRRNPALRHGVCVCALICVFVAPITTLGLQKLGWRTLQISLESDRQTVAATPTQVGAVATAEGNPHPPFWTLERARIAASLTILIWLAGTAVLLFRLVGGVRRVRRLRMTSHAVEHPKLRAAMQQLHSLEHLPSVPIRFSRKLHSPIVIGPHDTTVILPEKLLDQLSEDQLRCVLAHELTHVRQRDPLIGLVQRIVEAGYWPHPLVHVLNRDLVRAREEVCDNVALHGTTAPQYADTLLTVALGIAPRSLATPGAIGLMTRPWRLEERVKGLLDPNRRLTTTMNTRHLAFMAISLSAGITVIGGARIVAAPNPPSLQDTVELHAQYNSKTNSVVVTAKTHKQAKAKAAKVFRVQVSAPKAITVVGHPAAPRQIKVFASVDVAPEVRVINGIQPLTLKVDATPVITSEVRLDPTQSKLKGEKSITFLADVTSDGKTVTVKRVSDDSKPTTVTAVVSDLSHVSIDAPVTLSVDAKKAASQAITILSDAVGKQQVTVQNSTDQAPRVVLMSPHDKLQIVQAKSLTLTSPNERPQAVTVGQSPVAEYYITDVGEPHIVTVRQSEAGATVRSYMLTTPKLVRVNVQKPSRTTTVYVQGSDIKIVGDDVRVVYVKAKPAAKKASPKPKANKPAPKG